jgi:hypothetical protein
MGQWLSRGGTYRQGPQETPEEGEASVCLVFWIVDVRLISIRPDFSPAAVKSSQS